MLLTIVVLFATNSLVQSSGVSSIVEHAPVVTAASSQYFERTFNRLVVAPPVLEPVIPISPVAPPPPVVVDPVTRTVPVADPTQNVPIEPNVAIAIATAHAAAPVATILLPPYPFGPPPTLGFIPPAPPVPPVQVPEDESRKEATTKQTTVEAKTTLREAEPTTPFPSPSNTANSFARALPSNQNVNFKQYYAPPFPQQSAAARPQKLKTSVEIVPVPLAYIAPPPLVSTHHHHTHGKSIKYVHSFIPTRARIIIRPVRTRTVRVPTRLAMYKAPILARNVARSQRPINSREIEPTTFKPFNRPITKPPRV